MPALGRAALEGSPLSDLHALASELGIDGFRRLRKADLIDTLIERQGGAEEEQEEVKEPRPPRSRRPRPQAATTTAAEEPRTVEGVVELLSNGSGFVRVAAPEQSDDDVYISAAQARRCELVSGDRVSGPVRPARRSERFPSLVRIETINDLPADQAARVTKLEERAADFPTRPLPLGDDRLLAEIARVAPLGMGSRATVAGPSRSGKSEIVRRLAEALRAAEGLEVELLLVGVRPEELSATGGETVEGLSFAAPPEAQASAVEQAVERARRIATRGGDAVLLVDTLDGLHPPAARRALAAARQLRDGGSLTIIATCERPLGGETAVIALRADGEGSPAIDEQGSGTMHAELLRAPG
jgi:transcription termination factor Rho